MVPAGYNKKTAQNYYKESERINKSAECNRFLKLVTFPLKNKVVLDAGCGFGYDCNFFLEKGAKIFGVDASPHLIKIAKEKYPRLSSSFSTGNIEKLPFADNCFDVIISKYALHYLKNPDLAFKEFYRCLKKNGILIFCVHHPISAFFFKKNKDYFKKEKINFPILKDVRITQTTHAFTDYLSKYLLDNFTINYIEENRGNVILSPSLKIPEYLLVKATKK